MNTALLLPHESMQFVALHFGWALVLAAGLVWVLQRVGPCPRGIRAGAAVAMLAWCMATGPISPAYWLGLAFQAPSLCTALICALVLRNALRSEPAQNEAPASSFRYVLIAGVVLGWLLVLDMLAWLPVQLYTLGFYAIASGPLLLLGLLPVALQGATAWRDPRVRVLPGAVILFVISHWYTGNVWDAILDPWLWLVLNGLAVRSVFLWRQASTTSD